MFCLRRRRSLQGGWPDSLPRGGSSGSPRGCGCACRGRGAPRWSGRGRADPGVGQERPGRLVVRVSRSNSKGPGAFRLGHVVEFETRTWTVRSVQEGRISRSEHRPTTGSRHSESHPAETAELIVRNHEGGPRESPVAGHQSKSWWTRNAGNNTATKSSRRRQRQEKASGITNTRRCCCWVANASVAPDSLDGPDLLDLSVMIAQLNTAHRTKPRQVAHQRKTKTTPNWARVSPNVERMPTTVRQHQSPETTAVLTLAIAERQSRKSRLISTVLRLQRRPDVATASHQCSVSRIVVKTAVAPSSQSNRSGHHRNVVQLATARFITTSSVVLPSKLYLGPFRNQPLT